MSERSGSLGSRIDNKLFYMRMMHLYPSRSGSRGPIRGRARARQPDRGAPKRWGCLMLVVIVAAFATPVYTLADGDDGLTAQIASTHDPYIPIGYAFAASGSQKRPRFPCRGQTGPRQPDRGWYTLTLYFENDGTFVKRNHPTDRHYTNGVRLTVTHQPRWGADLARNLPWAPGDHDRLQTAVGYTIGQNIYTPEEIENPNLIPDDQPYAGWFYGGVYLQRASQDTFDHIEIDLGLVGPSSLAEDAQRSIHKLRDLTEPQGWDNQLRDEVGLNLVYRRKWRLPLLTHDSQPAVELIPQIGFTLGTINRHLSIGATVRAGVNLPDDFGPGSVEDPVAATATHHNNRGAYLFARFGGKAVEHDTFLEGSNFSSSHSVDPEPLVGEVQVGFVLYWDRLTLGYAQTFLSRRFEGQRDKDSFGGFTLAWTHEF